MFNNRLLRLSRTPLLVLTIVFTTVVSPQLLAGSKRPNPAALQKASAELAAQQASVHKQVDALLHRLANDAEFAKTFDAATYKQDRKTLSRLITEGGITDKFTIDEIDKDLRIRITIRCSGRECTITITIRW